MKFVILLFKRYYSVTIIFIYRKCQKSSMKHALLTIVLMLLLTLSVAAHDGIEHSDADVMVNSDKLTDVRIKTADGVYREKTEAKDGVIETETKLRTANTEFESRTKLVSDGYEDRLRLKTHAELLEDSAFTQLKQEQKLRLRSLNTEELRRLAQVDTARLAVLAQLSEENLEKISNLDQAELRELAMKSPEEIRLRLSNVHVIEGEYRLRTVGEARIRTTIDKLAAVQRERTELREHYEDSVEELRAQRELLRECNADCDEIRNETLQHAKDVALHMVERLVNHLESVEARIEAAEDLPEEDATLRLEAITALKTEAAEIEADIEAATTAEELREAVADLRELIQKIKRGIISHAHALLRAHAIGLINRGEILERKMTCSLDSLAEAGVNTTEVDAKIETYNSLMEEARLKIREAAQTYDRTDREAIGTTKDLLKEARALTEEAQQLAVEIRADIQALGGSACTAPPEVAIDESAIDLDAANIHEEAELESEVETDHSDVHDVTIESSDHEDSDEHLSDERETDESGDDSLGLSVNASVDVDAEVLQ